MKIVNILIAFIVTASICAIVDLIINYVMANTVEWKVLSEQLWKILISIGRISLGYFYGSIIFKEILKQLEN